MKNVIETSNLSKVYKLKDRRREIKALDNINLNIKNGEIFGLLGPNGAGKTTFVSILTTLIKPTSGRAKVLGYDVLKKPKIIRKKVGLMLGGDMIYYRLTGYQNLEFFCKLYGIKNHKAKINHIIEKINLKKWKNEFVSQYSTGMKVKLALARVLLIEPEIFFLDEPMLGLDPNTVEETMKILIGLNKTILLTSHQMNVVEKLCDRIAFLKKGKILKVDTKDNFKKLRSSKIKISVTLVQNKDEFVKSLEKVDFVSEIISTDKRKVVFNINSSENLSNLFNRLKDYPVISFREIETNLDDVFIEYSK